MSTIRARVAWAAGGGPAAVGAPPARMRAVIRTAPVRSSEPGTVHSLAPDPQSAFAPSASHLPRSARSSGVILVRLPIGIAWVAIVCW
jgi:hypothetical protein